MTKRVALAASGRVGRQLADLLNHTRADGTKAYGVTVILPQGVMTGQRWDLIIALPCDPSASDVERDRYTQWLAEVAPTKLHIPGELIRLD